MPTTSVLSDRTTSSWPISIGTALSLESMFTGPDPVYDPDRSIPEKVKIEAYQEFWINLSTVYRNIVSSVSSSFQKAIAPGDALSVLEFETELIRELVEKATYNKTKVIYYFSHYNGLAKKHPHARLRIDSTEKQKEYSHIRDRVIEEYLKRHRKENEVLEFDLGLKPASLAKALILTHDAYDLLSAKKFKDLHLLESHTGKLKTKTAFYTKFHTAKDAARIPFTSTHLQVFGDSLHFAPFPIADRAVLLQLAEARQWTALTTVDRLRLSYELMEQKEFGATLLAMSKEI